MEYVVGWSLFAIIVGLVAINALIHLIFALVVLPLFERKPPFGVEVVPEDPEAERIAIPTRNGLTLRGSLRQHADQPSRGLILFCPEFGGNHWSAGFYAAGLFESGFDVISFDFRNQGESDSVPGYDPLHWLTEFEVSDLLEVIEYTRQREDLRELSLGLFGVSRGASAALAAGAHSSDVKCVACEGVFSTNALLLHYAMRWASLYLPAWVLKRLPVWHLQVTLGLARRLSEIRRRCRYTNLESLLPNLCDKPVLLITGERDTYVVPEIGQSLCDRIGGNSHRIWQVAKAKHNLARRVGPEAYDREVTEFFSSLTPLGHRAATREQQAEIPLDSH